MTKQELLDFSADHIGKLWTVEDHQMLVVGLRDVERLEREHAASVVSQARVVRSIRPAFHAAGDPDDDAPRYRHSLIDPDAAEI